MNQINTANNAPPVIGEAQATLSGLLKFEGKSLAGRLLKMDAAPAAGPNPRLLHLGSGHNNLPGFVNADFFVFKPQSSKPQWMLDLRYPLRCPDNSWDGVFTEHTFEHLYPSHIDRLLKELYRSMKPGAWLRIVVPDVQKYIDYYCGRPVHENFEKYYGNGNTAVRTVSQNHFHFSLWDAATLCAVVEKAGFVNAAESSFGTGSDPRIVKDTAERQWESLYVEARKPAA